MNDVTNSIAHITWNCKYHIVFAPKYRKMVFFKEKKNTTNSAKLIFKRVERNLNNTKKRTVKQKSQST